MILLGKSLFLFSSFLIQFRYSRRAREATSSIEINTNVNNNSPAREYWSIDDIASLKVETIAENPSFIFLWCGSEDGLDIGRLLFKKWGFRRCEDIVWLKTNKCASKQKSSAQKDDFKRRNLSDPPSHSTSSHSSSSVTIQTESVNKDSSLLTTSNTTITSTSKDEINSTTSLGVGEFSNDPTEPSLKSYSDQDTSSEIGETVISENRNEANRKKKKHIFKHTKEHCLMGIKGTVRRNQDGHIIHANIDTDIIIAEDPISTLLQSLQTGQGDDHMGTRDIPFDSYFKTSTHKPEELYHVIEHFCLGRRRIELFGTDNNLRAGWVTLGADTSIPGNNYSPEKYKAYFTSLDPSNTQPNLLGTTPEIEELRPKSPSVTKNLTGK